MIKFVMVIRRGADLAAEEFHRYWLHVHGPSHAGCSNPSTYVATSRFTR